MDPCMDEDPDTRDSGISVDSHGAFDFKDVDDGMDVDEIIDEIQSLSPRRFSPFKGFRKGLQDVTNRTQSCFFESPKARQSRCCDEKPRKRAFGEQEETAKRRKEENDERRRTSLHRVQSTSVLERGIFAHDVEGPSFVEVSYSLETLDSHDSAAYRRIATTELRRLLQSMTEEEFRQRYVLVDCRYEFEYYGGHIKHSINVFDPERVGELFFPCEGPSRIPIFYCEFSQKRGPNMAHQLRRLDRARNEYPRLSYEEMYVVDGGYRRFFEDEENRRECVPCSYIKMIDPQFKDELKKFSFHKTRSAISMTGFRNAAIPPPVRNFGRQTSVDAVMSPSRSSRRGLFPDTPETSPSTVTRALTFS